MKEAVILVLLAVIAVLAAIGNDHPAVQAQIEDVSVHRADFPLCVNVKPPPLLRGPQDRLDYRMGPEFNDKGVS